MEWASLWVILRPGRFGGEKRIASSKSNTESDDKQTNVSSFVSISPFSFVTPYVPWSNCDRGFLCTSREDAAVPKKEMIWKDFFFLGTNSQGCLQSTSVHPFYTTSWSFSTIYDLGALSFRSDTVDIVNLISVEARTRLTFPLFETLSLE